MNKNILRFLGTLIFAFGTVDAINIVDFILLDYLSWVLAIIGIFLIIASNFIPKEKPTDQ